MPEGLAGLGHHPAEACSAFPRAGAVPRETADVLTHTWWHWLGFGFLWITGLARRSGSENEDG